MHSYPNIWCILVIYVEMNFLPAPVRLGNTKCDSYYESHHKLGDTGESTFSLRTILLLLFYWLPLLSLFLNHICIIYVYIQELRPDWKRSVINNINWRIHHPSHLSSWKSTLHRISELVIWWNILIVTCVILVVQRRDLIRCIRNDAACPGVVHIVHLSIC